MVSYLFDLLQFIKEVVISRWPDLAIGGVIGFAWLVFEKCTRRPVSMKVFIAILATTLFFATFHAWREQYSKSQSDLTMSVLWYRFDPETNEFSADVQFANKGTIRRTVLGVTFTYRSKDQNGQNLMVPPTSNAYAVNIYDASAPPVYVEPNSPIVRTYKYTLHSDLIELTKKPGEVFGLYIASLKPDSSMSFTTIEAMTVVEYQFGEQKGISLISTGKTNVSLDANTCVKMNAPVILPSPAPDKEEPKH